MKYRLGNPQFEFVQGITLRTPGARVRDVRVGASRVQVPQGWEVPAYRLHLEGDSATVRFDRPDNFAHYAFDILSDGPDAGQDAAAPAAPAVVPQGLLHPVPRLDDAALRQQLQGQRIVFLGTARDCAAALPATLRKLRQLGRLFGHHEVHVFENDSRDGTGELLDALAADGLLQAHREPGVHALMPLRTERLAFARNRLLDAVLDRQPWDYVCWADMDGLVGDRFSVEGFLSNFQYAGAWDAVFPVSWPLYYDIYALREPTLGATDYVLDGQHRFNAMLGPEAAKIHAATQQLAPGRLKGWLPVTSAFGGLGLYKASVVRHGRYVGVVQGEEICEHVPYHEALCRAGARLYLNPDCMTHIA